MKHARHLTRLKKRENRLAAPESNRISLENFNNEKYVEAFMQFKRAWK